MGISLLNLGKMEKERVSRRKASIKTEPSEATGFWKVNARPTPNNWEPQTTKGVISLYFYKFFFLLALV